VHSNRYKTLSTYLPLLLSIFVLLSCDSQSSQAPLSNGETPDGLVREDTREVPTTDTGTLGDTLNEDTTQDLLASDLTNEIQETGTNSEMSDLESDETSDLNPDASSSDTIDDVTDEDICLTDCDDTCEIDDEGWIEEEICDDGQDNNGDGLADEGCPCTIGAAQACYVGPPVTRSVGGCLDGVQICSGDSWGICQGGFVPSDEFCDLKDNDCDGCIDDGLIDCEPSLDCPIDDIAAPLSYYVLDGPSIYIADDSMTWQWTVVPPFNSGSTGPENPNAATTRTYLDVSGDYLISLEVLDEKGGINGCSWIVHVQGDGLRVELWWDTFGSVDLDLHLHRSGSTTAWCNTNDDCHYVNCQMGDGLFGSSYTMGSWGYPNSSEDVCETSMGYCPNPRLDLDNISGTDPENINIDNPNDGDTFRIMVHMYSGSSTTHPRVSFYCGGTLTSVIGEEPDTITLNRSGASCMGQTWRVADVKMIVDEASGITDCLVNILSSESTGSWLIMTDNSAF
jgi:hypothetical protein